jgi:glycerophosphoryl diester phosphodiesterase
MKLIYFLQILTIVWLVHALPLIIAHRGDSSNAPENSLMAFEMAVTKGAKMVELDLQLSKDQQLVVMHDETVDRTTNGRGQVSSFTLEQLKKFDMAQGQKIPTLAEVIELVDRKAMINIELKDSKATKILAKLLNDFLSRGWQRTDFLVASFDYAALAEFHALLPEVKLGKLFMFGAIKSFLASYFNFSLPESLFTNLAGVQFIGIPINLATKENIKIIHDHQLLCYVYTVKNQAQIKMLAHADGLFSDYLPADLIAQA